MGRLTRSESKALTRERLLAAGRSAFLRDGFHGTTLERIAEDAGYTKGAIYSAFASKSDFFLALFDERVEERVAAYEAITQLAEPEDVVPALVDRWTRVLREEREWSLALIEFWAFAARHEDVRGRFSALHERSRRALAATIAAAAERTGRELAVSSELLALTAMALTNGFVLEGFTDPAMVEGDRYETVIALLASTAVRTRKVGAAAAGRRRSAG